MIRIALQHAADGGRPARELSDSAIRKLARSSLAEFASSGTVTVRLVGEAESRELNRAWRGANRPTNVLAFPADRAVGQIGDIVICLPVARSEARQRGCDPAAHLAHLVVHGCLHLAGHDHKEPEQTQAMESQESKLLEQAGWPDPWAEERA
ncbi:MAG: rRNA maturation RNase YbeY [Gammaproteobacteria bacterium]|nr:rRNA maturation RNase YbeY [Gammaproteobacteria bacterium]MCY4165284.1 rRNA maturation RNase YbeY [Gammaproteobacteria bacterium]MCY4255854.1 rRNA maturation RNase YbeY [Gammaproteobacteria bacterium]MCY4340390.1 rRNA maturation RNase YbeY [Gammaproteobacteria bacterium]